MRLGSAVLTGKSFGPESLTPLMRVLHTKWRANAKIINVFMFVLGFVFFKMFLFVLIWFDDRRSIFISFCYTNWDMCVWVCFVCFGFIALVFVLVFNPIGFDMFTIEFKLFLFQRTTERKDTRKIFICREKKERKKEKEEKCFRSIFTLNAYSSCVFFFSFSFLVNKWLFLKLKIVYPDSCSIGVTVISKIYICKRVKPLIQWVQQVVRTNVNGFSLLKHCYHSFCTCFALISRTESGRSKVRFDQANGVPLRESK